MNQNNQETTNVANLIDQILIKPSNAMRQIAGDEAAGCTGKCVSGTCRTIG